MQIVSFRGEFHPFGSHEAAGFLIESERVRRDQDLEEADCLAILSLAEAIDEERITLEQATRRRDDLVKKKRPLRPMAQRAAIVLAVLATGWAATRSSPEAQGAVAIADEDTVAVEARPVADPAVRSREVADRRARAPLAIEGEAPDTPNVVTVAVERKAPVATALPISSISGSRSYRKHPADHAIDGDLSTGWQVKRKRRKLHLELDLGEAKAVDRIEIANGNQKMDEDDGDLFPLNSRPAGGTFELDDGTEIPFELAEDARGYTAFAIGGLSTRRVRIVFDRYHRGSRWRRDVCVSEVRVIGTQP